MRVMAKSVIPKIPRIWPILVIAEVKSPNRIDSGSMKNHMITGITDKIVIICIKDIVAQEAFQINF